MAGGFQNIDGIVRYGTSYFLCPWIKKNTHTKIWDHCLKLLSPRSSFLSQASQGLSQWENILHIARCHCNAVEYNIIYHTAQSLNSRKTPHVYHHHGWAMRCLLWGFWRKPRYNGITLFHLFSLVNTLLKAMETSMETGPRHLLILYSTVDITQYNATSTYKLGPFQIVIKALQSYWALLLLQISCIRLSWFIKFCIQIKKTSTILKKMFWMQWWDETSCSCFFINTLFVPST